eukprot:516691-Pelagomonas_calceolata.AAC.1
MEAVISGSMMFGMLLKKNKNPVLGSRAKHPLENMRDMSTAWQGLQEIGLQPKTLADRLLGFNYVKAYQKKGTKSVIGSWQKFRFTLGDLQPDCSGDRPVTGPRQPT